MNYIAECLEKFQALSDDVRNDLGAGLGYAALKRLEEEFGLQLAFVLILLAIDELEEEDLPEYLMGKYSLSADKAQALARRIMVDVFDPAVMRMAALEAGVASSGSENIQSANYDPFYILSIFQGGLLSLLKGPIKAIKNFNISVFAAFDADPDLEEKVINALYANKEMVSKNKLLTEDKEHRPTVGNWIKDFVVLNGSGLFDGLALAKYLSTSQNCQHLDAEDKALVSKVLKTYRNLVFFPESMDNVPLEMWEVLPVENENGIRDVLTEEESTVKAVVPKRRTSTVKREVVEAVLNEAASVPESAPEAIVEATPKEESTAAKLQAALNDYATGSLEYKVIKQELDRLRQTVSTR